MFPYLHNAQDLKSKENDGLSLEQTQGASAIGGGFWCKAPPRTAMAFLGGGQACEFPIPQCQTKWGMIIPQRDISVLFKRRVMDCQAIHPNKICV